LKFWTDKASSDITCTKVKCFFRHNQLENS
jgi:hypothetical protein